MPEIRKSEERWSAALGKIIPAHFNAEQLHEIEQGQSLALPVQLYANPELPAEQMKTMRTMLETVYAMLLHPEKRIVCTEYGPVELEHGFKSWTNFESFPDRVCYIPENWDFEYDGSGYTGRDILEQCDQDPIKARMIFSMCQWQHPSTVLGEWDEGDEEALYEKHLDLAAMKQSQKTGSDHNLCRELLVRLSLDELRQINYPSELETMLKTASTKTNQPDYHNPTVQKPITRE